MEIITYEQLAFTVGDILSDNKDGINRQDIIKGFIDDEDVVVNFKVFETNLMGKDVYSVMANNVKIGEIQEEDREVFELNIENAVSAKLRIAEEQDADGNPVYMADAILKVPYTVLPNDMKERVKKRGAAVKVAILLIAINAVVCLFKLEWLGAILSFVVALGIYYWAFIKKSGKIYDFIFKKDRKINDFF